MSATVSAECELGMPPGDTIKAFFHERVAQYSTKTLNICASDVANMAVSKWRKVISP